MAGTATNTDPPSRSMMSSSWPGSNARAMTTVPPMCHSGTVRTFHPPVWNMGNTIGVTSSSRSPQAVIVLREFQTTPLCVMTVSLGVPVEPPVCKRRCVSSGAGVAVSTGLSSSGSESV